MKKIIGWILIAIFAIFIVGGTILKLGLGTALILWGGALALTAIIVIGVYLILD
jgi:hypothetical protein